MPVRRTSVPPLVGPCKGATAVIAATCTSPTYEYDDVTHWTPATVTFSSPLHMDVEQVMAVCDVCWRSMLQGKAPMTTTRPSPVPKLAPDISNTTVVLAGDAGRPSGSTELGGKNNAKSKQIVTKVSAIAIVIADVNVGIVTINVSIIITVAVANDNKYHH